MEQQFKDKLKDFEFEYNAEHWGEMNKKLDAEFTPGSTSVLRSPWAKIAAAVVVVAGLAVSSYYIVKGHRNTGKNVEQQVSDNTTQQNQDLNAPVVENNQQKTETANNHKEDNSPTSEVHIETTQENQEDSNAGNKGSEKQQGDHASVAENQPGNEQEASPSNEIPNDNAVESGDELAVLKNIKFSIIQGDTEVCPGEVIKLKVDNPVPGYKYTWEFGDGGIEEGTTVSHKYLMSGSYDVVIVPINQNNGTVKTRTRYNGVITVRKSPGVDFIVDNSGLNISDPYTKVEAIGGSATETYNWNFGNGVKKSGESIEEVVFEKQGQYTIVLTSINQYGCSSKISHDIYNEHDLEYYVFAPNTLLPNTGQSKETKSFIPAAVKGYNVDFTLIIKDLNGNVVYQTTDAEKPWNGRRNNVGELMPEGYYTWQLNFIDKKGVSHTVADKVRLLLSE